MTPQRSISTAAVLTGDIVGSSELPRAARSSLPGLIKRTVKALREEYTADIPHPVDLFRGDSWQLVVIPPRRAFRIALSFRASLRHGSGASRLDTRIGIGIGTVDFINPTRVSQSDGEAFRRSGAALEGLGRRGRRMALAVPAEHQSDATRGLDVIFGLVDALSKQWTARQALAVHGALRGQTQEEIGSEWQPEPITQQAVAQHLDAAGWNAIDEAIELFEAIIDRLQPSDSIHPADQSPH